MLYSSHRKNSVILFFEAAYFCCQRAYGMLGIGVENCITILSDENFSMRMDLSQEAIEKCQCDVDQRIGRATKNGIFGFILMLPMVEVPS